MLRVFVNLWAYLFYRSVNGIIDFSRNIFEVLAIRKWRSLCDSWTKLTGFFLVLDNIDCLAETVFIERSQNFCFNCLFLCGANSAKEYKVGLYITPNEVTRWCLTIKIVLLAHRNPKLLFLPFKTPKKGECVQMGRLFVVTCLLLLVILFLCIIPELFDVLVNDTGHIYQSVFASLNFRIETIGK